MSSPRYLAEFIGQPELKQALSHLIENAKNRRQLFPHLILCGPRGCGKSTLARTLPNELGTCPSGELQGARIGGNGDGRA